MRISLLFIFTAFFGNTLAAQTIVQVRSDNSLRGNTVYLNGGQADDDPIFVDLKDGSPFFSDHFAKSRIVTENGDVLDGVSIKLNLMQHIIHYLDKDGKELVLNTVVNGFAIEEGSSGKLCYFVNGNTLPVKKNGWYQMLVKDSITLVKQITKTLTHHQSYGSPKEYSIKTGETYVIFHNNKEYEIKKPSDFSQFFPEKEKEIEAQFKKIKKLPKEEQMVQVTLFFNKLLKMHNKRVL